MDIIKIFEKIRKYNAENNAIKDLDPIKTKTFKETVEFINGSSIESHRNYGESIRGFSQPLFFFDDEPIYRTFSIDDFINDNESE